MRTRFLAGLSAVLICLLFCVLMPGEIFAKPASYPAAASEPEGSFRLQLLQNRGCEETLVGGEIPQWVEVLGANWTQRNASPSPQEGYYYFFAGAGASAELRQDADISGYSGLVDAGTQLFEFSAWVRAWDQSPADISQIILEYLNHDKSLVLASFDLGQHTNTDSWLQLLHSATAPVGSRFIRVRLISIRRSGTNNDGYFDNLSLSIVLAPVSAPEDLEISISGTDVMLSWSPVTHDTLGNPITISRYDVYAGSNPDFICDAFSLEGSSPTAQITLPGFASGAGRSFFRVIAVTE